ncbi:MAG: hypothetical protein ACYTX0_57300, partial [Nostoc sp.]
FIIVAGHIAKVKVRRKKAEGKLARFWGFPRHLLHLGKPQDRSGSPLATGVSAALATLGASPEGQ